MLAVVIILSILSALMLAVLVWREMRHKMDWAQPTPVTHTISLDPVLKRLNAMPDQVLKVIQGSNNNHKGSLGELIGFLSLKAEYDRVIPLNTIVDFMGIKFPTKTEPGYVHFIDVKTGTNARLSTDQRRLKTLLDANLIGFRTIKVDDVIPKATKKKDTD